MVNVSPVPAVILVALAIAAAGWDASRGRIPNPLTLGALLLGPAMNFVLGGRAAFISSLLGAGVGFALFLLPHLAGGLGAGDVKLAAAVGALMGFPFVVWAAVNACLVGLVVSLAVVLLRGELHATFSRIAGSLRALLVPGVDSQAFMGEGSRVLPFGVFLAAGAVLNLYTGARYAALDLL